MFANLYRKKTINRITKKCNLLGSNNKIKPIEFMNIRLLLTIVLFLLILIFMDKGYFFGPIIAIIFYVSFEYILDYKIKKRINLLNYEAIFFFQILSLTLENGRSLKKALEITTENINNEISNEFKKMLKEVDLGKTMEEALMDMKEKIPSEEVNTVILNIRESTIFGNEIYESLNNQIDYLRDKKILNIKSQINKIPMKISVVSVLFIVPIILLLVLGPVLINYIMNN